jgi:hypothetical protein
MNEEPQAGSGPPAASEASAVETKPTEAAPAAAQTAAPQAEPEPFRLIIFQTGSQRDPLGDMNALVFNRVQWLLDDNLKTPPEETTIDVWLESPGGSASVAYKLFLELSHRCNELRFVIPDFAKSAATLLALGGDVIFMAPAAELGPLDAQIGHPDREGVRISALDLANALGFLTEFATNLTVTGGYEVLEWTELPRVEVLREFSRFSARLLEPLMSKLDPHLIHQAKNELELAKQYAMNILRHRHVDHESGDMTGLEIADQLVKSFPAHEFLIGRDDAETIGLPVQKAEEYDKWDALKSFHRKFHEHSFSGMRPRSIVRVWKEPEKKPAKNGDGGPK